MGLATSQARFLCITARKADCEYKSTELAQQKLEITNQLSDISANYANAMNSTKLVWKNDLVKNDYGLTYNLLMTPSAANDYNPYMVTTSSGAIVLNSEYAAAAKAAGISKAGGIASADGRDKFIAALVPNGIVTQDTANSIMTTDYVATKMDDGTLKIDKANTSATTGNVGWNSGAGMGSTPLDKNSVDGMDKAALIMSDLIGKQLVDWAQLITTSSEQITSAKYDSTIKDYDVQIKKAATALQYAEANTEDYKVKEAALNALKDAKADFIKNAKKNGIVDVDRKSFQMDNNSVHDTGFTVVSNGTITYDEDTIKKMTIGDLLSSNIVLMTQNQSADKMSKYATKLMESIASIFGYRNSGHGLNMDSKSNEALEFAMTMVKNINLKASNAITQGSSCDDKAMTNNSAYINANDYNRIGVGQKNILGTDIKAGTSYQAVSVSNLLSSFLTYYDNYMNGNSSAYVVGKRVDTSAFVTDDRNYRYFAEAKGTATSQKEKLADFYDQLYNNLCEKGWREDASVQDNEYLENALKTGRYAMSSLHEDGYFYQTRYNETGYIVEETDSDAIARAEAEFTQKKAELTYKEDAIDMKSKKLDAEISSLSTEYDTVKQLISKSIEKTFQMFQN